MNRDDDTYDGRLSEALDVCLRRLRAGEDLDTVLAEHPELAADLRPLLAQASALAADRMPPAPAPTNLAMGRARFLEAAARTRATGSLPATAAVALDDPQVTDALDESLARVRAGEAPERAVAAFPSLVPALAPLLATAGQVVGGRVTAPPAPRGLRPGRARMLAAAAELRAARAAGPMSPLARLLAALGLAGARPAQRFALGALGLVLILALSSGAASVAAANALPGDALYSIKRLGEQLRYTFTLDATARQAVVAEQSRERAEEITSLVALGRPAELAWDARFVRLEPAGEGLARLYVLPLGEGEAGAPVLLAWTAETRADLGSLTVAGDPLAALGSLAPGARLLVRVVTGGDGPPRLVYLQVIGPVQLVEVPRTLPAAAETAAPETATPGPETPTSMPTPATATATQRATSQSSPTVAASATAAATAVVEQVDEPEDSLTGFLFAKASDSQWRVSDSGQGGRTVEVDVSRAKADRRRAAQEGFAVKFTGHWTGADRSQFQATELNSFHALTCTDDQLQNHVIASIVGGVSLMLEGKTGEFWFVPSTVVEPGLMLNVGTVVDIDYRLCDGSRFEIVAVRAAKSQDPDTIQGIIGSLDEAAGTFILDEDGTQHRVRLAPNAEIINVGGGSTQLKNGQLVEISAHMEGTELVASKVVILQDAQASPAGASPVVPPTAEPTMPAPTVAAPPSEPADPPGEQRD